MRRLTLQGARWHQHGFYTRCINQASPAISAVRRSFSFTPRLEKGGRKQEVTIRHFEQSTPASKDRTEVDFDSENQAEQELLKAKIAELERELAELREGPFGPNSPFMKELSEEDRQKALEALRKYKAEHKEEDVESEEEERLDAEFDKAMERQFQDLISEEKRLWDPTKAPEEPSPTPRESFEVEITVPDTQQAAVARFNKTLKVLRNNPTFTQRQDAWRSYRRCKEGLPFFLDIIPEEGLELLWQSQVPSSPVEHSRLLHWEKLAEDILASGRDFTTTQWLKYLELLWHSGKSEKAIPHWEGRAQDLKHYSPEEVDSYLKLGVRLHVAVHQPQTAQDIAMAFLSANTSRDPRVLIPVIASWAEQATPKAKELAWTLYLQVKTMLGPNINMQDYDSISTGLLNAGQTELALAVFKDMMLTGQQSTSDSVALFKTSLGLYDNLHSSSINAADVNKASLAALTILPRKFHNKFFFASWMKKLIGMGEVDAAASVVELMYERGIKPDAKHLNGIIGGWLREGSPTAKEKAEKLAWAMVQERIERVWHDMPEKPSVYDTSNDVVIPRHMQRTVPAASIETFSILLLYYTRRDQENMANYLIDCLDTAQIKPNAFFMNHLLYMELRKQNILGVWTKYKDMTAIIKPDLATFACLYDCGKIQYDRTRYLFDAKFPPIRSLYKETMQWFGSLTPHQQKTTKEEFSKALYDQITRCFCLSLDPQGALVAIRSMKQIFGFFPDVDTTRILTFLLVRLAPTPPGIPKPRRRRIASTPRSKENFENISNLLVAIKDWKVAQLSRQGINPDELDEEEQKAFQVDLMCDLLRLVMRRIQGDSGKVEKSIRAAADEMAVGELDLGVDPDIEL
ncbi:pentatricopeptide repeat domain-containing protein [Coccidioides immitis RS]|uniref:Pentatricopeptide repeat domain-containing protein n=1 Tax=Coccidioides immitis (strain RS) TaxID=246410 RepID=J3KKY7_COCIM|nr:pentatricopeptide repeat domain-containing protein [Coccidioides immitis RS]EAS36895.3 pentatricopeptide repeat domain-containing protein [Coccidioides immitis RS]